MLCDLSCNSAGPDNLCFCILHELGLFGVAKGLFRGVFQIPKMTWKGVFGCGLETCEFRNLGSAGADEPWA